MAVLDCTTLLTAPCVLVVIGKAPSGNVTVLLLPGAPPDQLPPVDQF